MAWDIKYMEVYCDGKLIRRVSIRKQSKRESNLHFRLLFKEVEQAAKLSSKKYYIDLKTE